MTINFDSPLEGTYKPTIRFAESFDYGCCDVILNGRTIEHNRNFYSKEVRAVENSYDPVRIVKGANTLTIVARKAYPGIDGVFFGVDKITLEK